MVTPQTKGKDGSHPVKILALESSAVAASAALCEDETLIAQAFQNSGLTHSQTLLPMVEHLLQAGSLTPADLDLIAVAAGPGSFTGLRIGVATAKGWPGPPSAPAPAAPPWSPWPGTWLGSPARSAPPWMPAGIKSTTPGFRWMGSAPPPDADRAISLDDLVQELAGTQTPQLVVGDGAQVAMTR